MKYPYRHAALGGTFDRLHEGHRYIIEETFKRAEKVSIGITALEMIQDKELHASIEPFLERKESLENYLEKRSYSSRVQIFPLKDIYGSTLTDKTLDCIIVSKETVENAHLINEKRAEIGLHPLTIIQVEFITGVDEEIIASKRIRKGSIDRLGFPYISPFKKTLIMPENLRDSLSKPLHEPFSDGDQAQTAITIAKKLEYQQPTMIIAVGDIISNSLIHAGLKPHLSIIDLKNMRQDIKQVERKQFKKIPNPPGTIDTLAVTFLKEKIELYLSTKQPQLLLVEGEEDLLALPAILLAPLNSVVLYGQRDQGVVIIPITEDTKVQVEKLVKEFQSS